VREREEAEGRGDKRSTVCDKAHFRRGTLRIHSSSLPIGGKSSDRREVTRYVTYLVMACIRSVVNLDDPSRQ